MLTGINAQSDAPIVREGHYWVQTGAALIEVRTAAGPVKLRPVEGALRASTAFGSVFADLPSGARLEDSFLNTGSGDIVALPPSNLAVTIRAQIQSAGAGRIVSGFSEIRVAGMPLAGSRPAVAQGSLNGGGPLFRLADSGRVAYLRRHRKP